MPPRKKTQQVGPTATPTGGSGGSENALLTAPNRTFYALDLLMPQTEPYRPGHSYSFVLRDLMAKFGISETQAERDIAKAYEVIRKRVAATDYAALCRVELTHLAKRAAERGDVGDWSVAMGAWERLGKWAGLEQNDEDSLVKKLSDAALEVAIKSAAKDAMASMSDEEFEALAKARKERSA
jgi:hypothetical protein